MGNRLFVGNLSYNTTDDVLRTEFSRCGTVKDVHIVIDRESGRSRGFGFVEFATDGEASTAIQALDQQQLDGRTISVKEAEARKGGGGGPRPSGGGNRPSGNRPSFSGGGGGYSGGGGVGGRDGGRDGGGGGRKSKGSRRRREDNDWG